MNPIIQVEHFSKKYGDFTEAEPPGGSLWNCNWKLSQKIIRVNKS